MWFCEFGRAHLGQLDPRTGTVRELPTPTRDSGPRRMAAAPDGSIWFSEYRGERLGRVDPESARIQEWTMLSSPSRPYAVQVDASGRVWVSEFAAGTIAEFQPRAERFRLHRLPDPNAGGRSTGAAGSGTWDRSKASSA